MVFCVIHLEPPDDPPEDEEVYVIVPGAKAVMSVPLDALPQFLPLLEQAVGSAGRPQCPACHDAILEVAVCPVPHNDLPQTG